MRRSKTLVGVFFALAFACRVLAIPFCDPPSEDLGRGDDVTFCDSRFCVCNDPYGRVRCYCPPEVRVDEVVVKSSGSCALPREATALSVDNCDNVTVVRDAFGELKELQSVELSNIKRVSIENGAFRWKGHGLAVNLTNVTVVPDVASFSFSGRIDSVAFDNCYIGMIRAFAFSNIESARVISFRGCNVANIEAQAFKKFPARKFVVSGSQFNVIPSRFVFDVEVENLFKIESSFVDVVRTSAFVVNNAKVTVIADSRINSLESEALRMRTAGDVVVQNNRFSSIDREAFRGLHVDGHAIVNVGKPKFKFVNNSVVNYHEKSFYCNRTSFDVVFSRIMIDEACTCESLILWRDMIHDRRSTSEKTIETDVEPFWCHVEDAEVDLDYVSGREFYAVHCTTLTKSIFFLVIVVTAIAVSLVLVVVFVACFIRRRRKWNLVPTVPGIEHGKPTKKQPRGKVKGEGKGAGAKAIIVPDGRTYRETEVHVIVEKAEPLDVGYIPCKVVRDRSRSQISSK